ncbi:MULTISPECIES: class I SAM-dependent methyltransferase [Corynebacterium]|uniref:class I SAM-dependent methyltransferase n=1 Tax=Corynebacterium TaxID=1716 RepID=UPI00124E0A9B|nr:MULTISPECIES: class I SAM-dependent methyltransferase [Corynebacterium]
MSMPRKGPAEKYLQGHWLLASMGKRVLRPGGIELTTRLIEAAQPTSSDRIVELGPGVGRTAEILLAAHPRSYRGVDPNPEGSAQLAEVLRGHPEAEQVVADARSHELPDGSADLVVGEAMLTMLSTEDKKAVMERTYRLLAPGGRYAIHELAVSGDNATEVSREISRSIKVGARPLPAEEWQQLLEEAGFEVVATDTSPMRLLEPSRIIADEGLGGALRFFFRVLRNPTARRRIMQMRSVFRRHREQLSAVAFVARKGC